MKGGGFLGVAGGNWGRPGAPQQHRQLPPAIPPSRKHRPKGLSIIQRDIHLIEIKYCEDTRPQKQLSAAQEQHGLCSTLQGASSITLHTILLGVGGTICNNHTLESFKELGLDSQRAKILASKLHVHSVNYAAKLVHTIHALSSTIVNTHQETVLDQACNPPDPHWSFSFPFGGGVLRYSVPKWLISLNLCREGFFITACVALFFTNQKLLETVKDTRINRKQSTKHKVWYLVHYHYINLQYNFVVPGIKNL